MGVRGERRSQPWEKEYKGGGVVWCESGERAEKHGGRREGGGGGRRGKEGTHRTVAKTANVTRTARSADATNTALNNNRLCVTPATAATTAAATTAAATTTAPSYNKTVVQPMHYCSRFNI